MKKQINYWKIVALDRVYIHTTKNSKGQKYWIEHYDKLVKMIEELIEKVFEPNKLYNQLRFIYKVLMTRMNLTRNLVTYFVMEEVMFKDIIM